MALGASVTFGTGSTTGDSYRKDLQDLLASKGITATYVGTRANGNFPDNAVEATGDAGTNNCNKGGEVPDAGTNVTAMVNKIYENSPGSTVILASILANKVQEQDACREKINQQYAVLTTQFQESGAKFALVDMRGSDAPTVNDLADTRHPNDEGYMKMARVWMKGIDEVISKGFITAGS
ncbi:GDSL-like Lipase/Acylhydrolase [Colletotrichum tabaci]|uniref:GDSL-like Lipase/Acylhydrolase n=1 Tax=Colletotrichum tabaci TaxID=1209068 RepID=A0AAV9TKH1_9PEZI